MTDFFEILQLRLSAAFPQLVAGAVVAAAFWMLARFVGGWVMRMQDRVDDDHKELVGLLADVAGWAVFITGLVAGLGTAGFNVAALVAGLGLVAVALGLAMKDTLANVVAGLTILAYRPFARGDKVQIGAHAGRVAKIDLRYVTIEAKGANVLIPNAKIHTETVIVMKDMPKSEDAPDAKAEPKHVQAVAKPGK
ncbi:MAG: mechanosensitive ion channel [Alphaproteobacteria bacterium]|nr:mechanosensitive ion channel [Alphaproteobacteria bacterium]